VCFTSLVIKRYRERPQRPWVIFLLDVSKQALSASLAHTMNLLIATLLTHLESSNQCIWYFVNLTVDTSLGVLLCYLLVRGFEGWTVRRGWERVRTGEYWRAGKLDYVGWAMQVGVWIMYMVAYASRCFWVFIGTQTCSAPTETRCWAGWTSTLDWNSS